MSRCAGFDFARSSIASAGRESAVLCERVLSGDPVIAVRLIVPSGTFESRPPFPRWVKDQSVRNQSRQGRQSAIVPVGTHRFVGCPDRDTLAQADSHWHGGLTSAARCLLMIAALFASAVSADDTKDGGKKDAPKEPGKAGVAKFVADLTPEQEAAALAFAGEHHPELKTLVESLKSANPDGYKKAVHDLYRTQERLSKVQGNKFDTTNRYDHALALWELDSRIRLTAARNAMKDTDELRAELKTLVEKRQALVLQQLKIEREQTAARLMKIDADLLAAEANPAQTVDAEVERLLNSAKTKKPSVTANFNADKQKKPGKPKGEAQPGEGKPKGEAAKPKGEAKPGEGKPKGEANPKGVKQPTEPQPEPKTP